MNSTIEIGKLIIDAETAEAFAAWLHNLVEQRRRAAAKVQTEKERDAYNDRCHEKLVAIARERAEQHGPIEYISAYRQAEAAYETWDEDEAGYLDVDEHFQLDDEWKESWTLAYTSRLEEIKRARRG